MRTISKELNPKEALPPIYRELQGLAAAGDMSPPLSPGGPGLPLSPSKTYTDTSPPSTKALYSDVASDLHDKGLHFSPIVELTDGVAIVDLPEEITKDPNPLWASYLVGHFISDAPHIAKVHATVNRLWNTKDKPAKIDAQFINPKTVLFRIEDKQMRLKVLKRHFWHIADVPLVVQEWTPDTEASKPVLTAIPLWVDLKGVPGHLFSHDGLTFFGDTIGKTVKLHPNTVRCTRLDVARILVVLNLEKPLPERINIRGTDTMITVSYPWLPHRCSGCQKWGHLMKDCRQVTLGTQEQRTKLKEKLAEAENDKEVNLPMISTEACGSDQIQMQSSGDKALDVIAKDATETEWQHVGNSQRASPNRVSKGRNDNSKPLDRHLAFTC